MAYRYLHTDQFYVGSEINDSAGSFGTGPDITIHSWEFTLNYGLTNRVNLALRFPFAAGTVSRLYADLNRHRASATGLGDISAIGTIWVWDPSKHPRGNLALGFGVKTPSGDNAASASFSRLVAPRLEHLWTNPSSSAMADGDLFSRRRRIVRFPAEPQDM